MTNRFIIADRLTPTMFPARIDEWVEEDHLARFVVDIIEQLDLSSIEERYRGTGTEPYHPSILLGLLFYGYSTGIFSSRKLEKATYELIPVRYICGDLHPDHDSIASFRKNFLTEITELFRQILLIAHEMKILKLGTISLDGTKIKANASKHKALSWEYANKIESQLKDEIKRLLELGAEADKNEKAQGLNIPEELKLREERLEKIAKAKAEIESRARAVYEEEMKEYERKSKERQDKEESGKRPRGKGPKAPVCGPQKKDQVNLTDEESRIMPQSRGGFVQAYNAQAAVDIDTMLIIENHLTQNTNDKKEVVPALNAIKELPNELGKPDAMLADSGYFSENNADECKINSIAPYIPNKRDKHNTYLSEHLKDTVTLEIPEDVTAVEQMKYKMQTKAGKELYAKRKSTIEPTFGVIKHVMGFRQFLLRGLKKVSGEWNLVCTAYNLKRLHKLAWAN